MRHKPKFNTEWEYRPKHSGYLVKAIARSIETSTIYPDNLYVHSDHYYSNGNIEYNQAYILDKWFEMFKPYET